MIPLGKVWPAFQALHKNEPLYFDGYSPTPLGVSINASAIYTALTGQRVDATRVRFTGLNPKRRKSEQALADTVWNLTKPAQKNKEH